MEVILLQDIKNVGKKGERINLKDGYARNLISKKQVAEANAKTLNDMKLSKQHEEKVAEQKLADAKELKEKIEKESVTVSVKMGKDGKVFGSVSSKEIAENVKKQLNFEIDKKKLVVKDPIKEIGTYNVPLKLHPQVTATLKVQVVQE